MREGDALKASGELERARIKYRKTLPILKVASCTSFACTLLAAVLPVPRSGEASRVEHILTPPAMHAFLETASSVSPVPPRSAQRE